MPKYQGKLCFPDANQDSLVFVDSLGQVTKTEFVASDHVVIGEQLTNVNGDLYFAGRPTDDPDGSSGSYWEPWKFDGDTAIQLAELNPGGATVNQSSSFPSSFTGYDDKVFFVARGAYPNTGYYGWVYDGDTVINLANFLVPHVGISGQTFWFEVIDDILWAHGEQDAYNIPFYYPDSTYQGWQGTSAFTYDGQVFDDLIYFQGSAGGVDYYDQLNIQVSGSFPYNRMAHIDSLILYSQSPSAVFDHDHGIVYQDLAGGSQEFFIEIDTMNLGHNADPMTYTKVGDTIYCAGMGADGLGHELYKIYNVGPNDYESEELPFDFHNEPGGTVNFITSMTEFDGDLYFFSHHTGVSVNDGNYLFRLDPETYQLDTVVDLEGFHMATEVTDPNLFHHMFGKVFFKGTSYNGSPGYHLYETGICSPTTANIIETGCEGSYTSPSGLHTWTQPGMYMDTISNALGCDSILTIDLSFTSIDTSVVNSGMELMANMSGANYQWIDCNTVMPLLGENGQTLMGAGGSYAVEIESNGCVDTSGCHWVSLVGINDGATSELVSVFPNPTQGSITVSVNANSGIKLIELFDAKGSIVFTRSGFTSSQIELDLPDEKGVYRLRVSGDELEETIPVVKY